MDRDDAVRVGVLGETIATRAGVAVPLGGRRQRAVLAALVVARGETVPADGLVECVWGNAPPANPAGTLQSYVSHLRRRLEPEVGARSRDGVIASSANGYALRLPPDSVDAWVFEQAVSTSPGLPPQRAAAVLEEALHLWRGPAYADYADEPWARAEVARLTELRHVARERLLGARLDAGEAGLLAGELEALVAEDPLREERWRLLVLALYRAQRQADALAALRRARRTLRDSLGVDPGPTLRALEREVLAQAPSLDGGGRRPAPPPSSPPGAPAPVASPPAVPGALPATDLSERDDELHRLDAAVQALAGGTGGLLLVEGPAGIGKSSLLGAATGLAGGRGVTALAARCSRLEQAYGFGVARQLLEPPLSRTFEGRLPDGAGAARGVFDDQADAPRAEGGFAVLHGLYRLTAALAAHGPLLLAVDDLHWCDSASLRYLAYLAARLDGLPVLLAATVRTGEDSPDAALLQELALDPGATVLTPGPLSRRAARDLVAQRLGEPAEAFVAVCHATTAGNPLLLRQLLRALEAAEVPPDISHVDTVRAIGSRAVASLVTLRLRRMPAEATAVARAVAVLGGHADLPTVAAFAEIDEARAAAMLEVLTRAEILSDCAPPSFVHPLLRDAVYHDQPAGERALHHERAARVLQRRGAALEHAATHLLPAPTRGDAATVALLRAAAAAAADRGATESAVTLLRRAAAEPPADAERADLLVQLGLVETLVDGPAAAAHLAEAHDGVDDPGRRAEIAVVLTRTHLFVSPPGVATAVARSAADALPAGHDDARQALVALERISAHMHGLPRSRSGAGRPEVAGEGVGARMLAAVLAHESMLDCGNREEAVQLARFALADDALVAADNGLLWVTAAVVQELADADLADFWERATTRAQRTGSLFAVLSVNLWRGHSQWRRGRLDEALQSVRDAVEQIRMWGGSEVSRAYGTAFMAGVLLDRGDPTAADALLRGTAGLPEVGEGARLVREARVRTHLAQGRVRQALEEVATVRSPGGVVNPAWCGWRRLEAEALARLGRREEALALADEEVALLRRWGAPSVLGAALRARGVLLDGAGMEDLEEAAELLAPTPATLELARACLALGRHPATPPDRAVSLLQRAHDLARATGAAGVEGEAAGALAARGVPAPVSCAVVVDSTARRRHALTLAAQGLDVPGIARRMFLPVATVETLLADGDAACCAPEPDRQPASSQPQVARATLPPTRPWSTT